MAINAVKPSAVPTWATSGGTRLEPSAGQKATGWTNGQRPPYNVMNWLQGMAYDWQQYLEDATDELDAEKLERDGSNRITGQIYPVTNNTTDFGHDTYRFRTIFGTYLDLAGDLFAIGQISVLGQLHAQPSQIGSDPADTVDAALVLNTGSNATNATDTVTAAVLRTAWRLGSIAGQKDGFDLNVWRTTDDEPAMRLRSIVDAAYSSILFTATLARWEFGAIETCFQDPPGDASTVARRNAITARNVPKAWATVRIDGTGVIGSAAADGHNVATAALGVAGGETEYLMIDFAEDFANTDYAVICSVEIRGAGNNVIAKSFGPSMSGGLQKTAGHVCIKALAADDGSTINLSGLSGELAIQFICFGRQ